MSIRDDLNKGFTIGDVTTVNYDDDAKIKVKDFYELDRLERTKTLELAGRVDIELVKRDTAIESMSENIEAKKDVYTKINKLLSKKVSFSTLYLNNIGSCSNEIIFLFVSSNPGISG